MEANDRAAARKAILSLPHPQRAAEVGLLSGDALVSVTGHGDPPARVDGRAFPGGILRVVFDDIPCAEWTDARGTLWRGPSQEQIASVLEFARTVASSTEGREALLPIHCLHGKSRSAALALAVMADAFGPGREADAVTVLLSGASSGGPPRGEALGQMACNPGIVRMADRMLGRNGRIEAALEKAMPRYVTWRAYWLARGCL